MYSRDERLRSIFESVPDAVVVVDASGLILDWNRLAGKLFGWRDDEPVGKQLATLIIAATNRAYFTEALRQATGGVPNSERRTCFPISVIDRAGVSFPVELAIQPLQLVTESVFAVFLHESAVNDLIPDSMLKRIAQGSPVVELHLLQDLMLISSATGTLEETVQHGLRIMCDATDWPVGQAWLPDETGESLSLSDVWHVPDAALLKQLQQHRNGFRVRRGEDLIGRIWETNEPGWSLDISADPVTGHLRKFGDCGLRGAFGFPIRVRRETAAILVFLAADSISPTPDSQMLRWAQTIGHQLTRILERRRWEAERHQLAAIVDSTYDAVIGKSLDGVITSWNAGAEATYGYSAREAIGQSARMLIPEQFGHHEPELADIARYGKQFNQFETIRRRKDGRKIDVTMTVSPIRDTSGRVVGTSSIERDSTYLRKREEDLKQANRAAEAARKAKNEFLANVSHELRTPMNAIIGMVELSLATDGLIPIVHDYLETASESAHVLLSLLDDLLDFSRMEAGRFDLDPQPFSLRQTLEEAMRILSLRAHERGLELACEIEADVPDRLEGDARRIRQIVMNLAGNSIKFTEQGEVVVRVAVQTRTDSEVQLLISVRDTGIGIALEDQRRIFAPFTQVDPSTTRRFSGTGLGLSISRELVERMGGEIWLESTPGQGTTFFCTPRCRVLPDVPTEDEAVVRELRDLQVLIVDDNATNRRILEQSLHSWSMKPLAVPDGQAALTQIEQAVHAGHPYPLLIVDGLMPELDGFTLIETLENRGLTAGAKILMLSSADRNTFDERCRHLPVNAYLEKPVSQSMLLDAIMTALRGPQLRRDVVERISATPLSLNILVAEDTPANQRVVKAILERRGHHVSIAHNGREAVDLHERSPYDIILMDVQMPTMDGLQATALIRSLSDDFARVPIIAMTAHAMRGDRERCLAAGMTSYISKPIDANQLVRLVERVSRDFRHSRSSWIPLPHSRSIVHQMEASEKPDPGPDHEATRTPLTRPAQQDPVASEKRSQVPVLSVAGALARLGGDQGLLRDMARFFLEDTGKLIEDLEGGIQKGELERAKRHAHSLKGLSANFNAETCVTTAYAVEEACRKGDASTANSLLPTLKVEVALLTEALQREILSR